MSYLQQRSVKSMFALFQILLFFFFCLVCIVAARPPSFPLSNGKWRVPSAKIFNVDSYGAKGDGTTDDKNAFLAAWSAACNSRYARRVVLVPAGKVYRLSQTDFQGPCNPNLIFHIAGRIVAAAEMSAWEATKLTWIQFMFLQDMVIQGQGTLDGNGHNWWSCKNSGQCSNAPNALTVGPANNIAIRGVKVVNSAQFQLTMQFCTNVTVNGVQIVAPQDSPNTDGIHITHSHNVNVSGCSIATGDDCVSIIGESSDINVKNLVCGPGHGVSIGSLGSGGTEDNVERVKVDGALLKDTSNGVRIKTWQGGRGKASALRFSNIIMRNVANPIIINQFYCGRFSQRCRNDSASAVKIRDIVYSNITGASSTVDAISLLCSDSFPCKHLLFHNVVLRYEGSSDVGTGGGQENKTNSGAAAAARVPATPLLSSLLALFSLILSRVDAIFLLHSVNYRK